jgi:hypothetical protein
MQGSDNGAAIVGMLLIVAAIAIYFLPSIVASNRRHQNAEAIAVLNLLLGWTVLGWIVALVWAFTAVQRPRGEMPPDWSADYDKARR